MNLLLALSIQWRDRLLDPIVRHAPTWITPNLITVFRGLLLLPLYLAYIKQRPFLLLVIFVFAFFLDVIDGTLARYRKSITAFGRIADPIVDKILFLSVLWWVGRDRLSSDIFLASIIVELWVVTVALLWKPILILLRIPVQIEANVFGKWKTLFQILGIVSLVFWTPFSLWFSIAHIFFFLSVIFGTISIGHHLWRVYTFH